jgi:hypothetical protein
MKTRFLEAVSRFLGALQQWVLSLRDEPTWRSHDGTVRLLSEMDTRHLRNCYYMLLREGGQNDKLAAIGKELAKR